METAQCLFAFISSHSGDAYRSLPHRHACTEIIYCAGEQGQLHQEERNWRYQPGQILVYQPGPEHWSEAEAGKDPGYHLCLGVGGGGAETIAAGVYPAELDLIPLFKLIEDVLRRGHGSEGTKTRLDLLSGLICLSLRELTAPERRNADSGHAATARRLIDARFMEDLTLDELASNVYISGDHLRYLFRREYGVGPIHYLLRKRIEYAQELLKGSPRKIHEIAALCGFDDPYYFSRIFKKICGRSPQQYRQE